MPRAIKFGVLPFFLSHGGKLKQLKVVDAASADEARRKAEIFAFGVGGAVAFSSALDLEFDVCEASHIIALWGEVPLDLKETELDIESDCVARGGKSADR